MNGRTNEKRRRLSRASGFVTGVVAAVTAVLMPDVTVAQEPAEAAGQEPLDEIVITGSRIRRTGFETLRPPSFSMPSSWSCAAASISRRP